MTPRPPVYVLIPKAGSARILPPLLSRQIRHSLASLSLGSFDLCCSLLPGFARHLDQNLLTKDQQALNRAHDHSQTLHRVFHTG